MRHLFLTGDMGVGKSHAIRAAVLPHIQEVGGFYAQRQMRGDELLGFRLCPVRAGEDYVLFQQVDRLAERGIFLWRRDCEWKINLDVFDREGVEYIRESLRRDAKLLVLDEMGGLELDCPAFMQAVLRALDATPCVGVLKSPKNTRQMRRTLEEDSSMDDRRTAFARALSAAGGEVLTMDVRNRDARADAVLAFVRACVTPSE